MGEFFEYQTPTTFTIFFGRELRRYRKAAGLSLEEFGAKMNYTGAFVGLIEQAKRSCPRDLAERADIELGARGALRSLWVAVNQETHPRWFQSFVQAEAEAVTIREFQPMVISGLLQTEPYATEVIRAARPEAGDEDVRCEVAARVSRRAVLHRRTPPRFWLILDEAVLRRVVGSRAIMFDALTAVLDAARWPRVTVQVLPFSAGAHAALSGSLILLEQKRKAAFCEGHAAGRIITDPEETAECEHAFNLLQSTALSVRNSHDLILNLTDEYR